MNNPKHISEILREIVQTPKSDFEKTIAQLPCFQSILKNLTNLKSLNNLPFSELEETSLSDWLDNQDVMQALHISPRTLQTLRTNGTLPFSRIGNKLYYRKQDILRILSCNYTMYKYCNDDE